MNDLISRQAAIEAIRNLYPDIPKINVCNSLNRWYEKNKQYIECEDAINKLSSVQQGWNNHTVACLLAELFGDTCACNFNGIDEWLPYKCELIDSCPIPGSVACWEQFLKHRAERRTDE